MKRLHRSTLSAALAGLVLGSVALVSVAPGAASAANNVPPVQSDNMGLVLKGAKRFVVRFADSMRSADIDALVKATEKGGRAKERLEFDKVFKGSVIDLKPAALQALMKSGKVLWAEPDQTVKAVATQDASQVWGLDRIDQRNLPLDSTYTYDSNGTGVTAYVVDTGILGTHTEFGSRVRAGYDALGGDTVDCNGHGTHVSGTIGGSTYGVAKNVNLVAVRVLDCNGSGTTSGVIAGIDWAIADHVSGPAVLNMSLGGGSSASMNDAVARAVADGITVVVAAGNSNADACTASPASAPSAITVGATDSTDARASYSNFGSCVDIFAPGSSIKSAYYTSNTATATLSGTSMASPHVAGAVARYLSVNPTATPAQATTAVLDAATTGVVANAGTGSPDKLLYASIAAPVTTTTTAAPTTTVAPTTTAAPTTTSAPTTTVAPTTTSPSTTSPSTTAPTTTSPTTTSPGASTTTVAPTTTAPKSTTTTTAPRQRTAPKKPTKLAASAAPVGNGAARVWNIMLTWSDDVAAGDTLIGHVFTVYSGDTPLRVLPTRVIGEKVVLVVVPPYKQSLTLSFAVSAVNRYGVSLPSDRSNTVTVAGRTANGSDASGSFAFDE